MFKKIRFSSFYRYSMGLIVLVLFTACHVNKPALTSEKQAVGSKFPAEYPELYKAVSVRSEKALLGFVKSSNRLVRNEAWRALFNTQIRDTSAFFDAVIADQSYPAWFALSGHSVTQTQEKKLEDLWNENQTDHAGISLVLGLQGDKQALSFLKNQFGEVTDPKIEYPVAMAMSRLLLRYPDESEVSRVLMEYALKSSRQPVIQACLYGAYRNHKALIDSNLADHLIQSWPFRSKKWDRLTRQMIINIVFKSGNKNYRSIIETDSLSDINVNSGVEIARDLTYYPVNEKSLPLYIGLLKNQNPNVVLTCLNTLEAKKWSNSLLADRISALMSKSKEKYPAIYVAGLKIMDRFQPNLIVNEQEELKTMAGNHPYQANELFELLGKRVRQSSFIDYLQSEIQNSDMRLAMAAVNAGNQKWKSLNDTEKHRWQTDYRNLFLKALSRNDFGLTADLYPFFMDTLLFRKQDFDRLKETMSHLSFPEDIEAYESLAPVLKKRFGLKGEHIVDSLAAKQFPPFNRYLVNNGWKSVSAGDYQKYPLLQPDWNRLRKLGRYPIWTLKTDLGTIKIRLNALRAPATVSAIDSLTRSGVYDGVPFHRVVPDFVIQGGDYERKDGYGGAGFVLPTEANEKEFIRGAVGIASAGTDTEGPQYFIMHQWAPHLNGHYTLFGQVIQGMDVVDRIMVGDKVIKASIESE